MAKLHFSEWIFSRKCHLVKHVFIRDSQSVTWPASYLCCPSPPRSTIGSHCSSWPSSVQRSYKTFENARVSESNFIIHAAINVFLCYSNTCVQRTLHVLGLCFFKDIIIWLYAWQQCFDIHIRQTSNNEFCLGSVLMKAAWDVHWQIWVICTIHRVINVCPPNYNWTIK